jgi:hypothetical protein
MIKDDNIFIFDFVFDKEILLKEFYNQSNNLITYTDPRGENKDLKIARLIDFDYANYLNSLFKINGKPRFFVIEENSTLPMHQDHETLCSINILLDENPAPIIIEEKEYHYYQGVLNTQKLHGVNNLGSRRIVFKLSVFDESYEQVCEKVKNVLNVS